MKRLSVLMATAFVDMLGFAIVFPLLPFYALRLDAEEWEIGWIIAIFSIAQLASAPLWGRLSDRLGRRFSILFGLGMSAVAFTIFGFATNLWMLFLSRLIQGLGGGTTAVLQAYVGDVTEPRDRAKALGWLSAATGAGVTIGPAIGSLATTAGAAVPGTIAASLCLINLIFAGRWLPESRPESAGRPTEPLGSVRGAILEVIRNPGGQVARLIWIYAVGMLGFMSMTSVLALYLNSDFGITERTIFIFFVYVGSIGVIMRAVMLGRLVDWLGETRVMQVGAVLVALGLFAIPLPTSIFALGAVMALVPIGTACLFPSVTALVTQRSKASGMGQTLGVQQTFGGVSRVLAPIWATAAFQSLGRSVPFFIASLVVAVVAVLAFRVKPVPESVGVPEAVIDAPIEGGI